MDDKRNTMFGKTQSTQLAHQPAIAHQALIVKNLLRKIILSTFAEQSHVCQET